MKANLRQQLFAEAYISTKGNGTESARRAGYSGDEHTLAQKASQLLRNVKVKALIAARTVKALVKVQGAVSPEEVIATLKAQMDGEKPARWKVISKDSETTYDPQGAAALLGKFMGLGDQAPQQPTNVTLNLVLAQMPREELRQYRAVLAAAETRAKAIDVEAKAE